MVAPNHPWSRTRTVPERPWAGNIRYATRNPSMYSTKATESGGIAKRQGKDTASRHVAHVLAPWHDVLLCTEAGTSVQRLAESAYRRIAQHTVP